MSDSFATAEVASFLHELHATMREVVAGLSPTELDWKPAEMTNSIAVLIAHALETERFLTAVVADRSYARDRAAAFRVAGLTTDELLALIDAAERDVDGSLAAVTPDRLGATIVRPSRSTTGAGWLLLVAAHSREHIGQASLTRQLAEQAGIGHPAR